MIPAHSVSLLLHLLELWRLQLALYVGTLGMGPSNPIATDFLFSTLLRFLTSDFMVILCLCIRSTLLTSHLIFGCTHKKHTLYFYVTCHLSPKSISDGLAKR